MPDNYANDDCQREIPQHRAAKEKQAQDRNERHSACKNGSAQRLVDARVHDFVDGPAPPAGQTLPDPVVNDDGIVNGIAGDGQHSANHRQRKFAAEKREHANRHEDVVQQRNNGSHGKSKFEAERHENQNPKNAQTERDQRAFASSPPTSAPTRSEPSTLKPAFGSVCMICFSTLSLVFNGVRMVM